MMTGLTLSAVCIIGLVVIVGGIIETVSSFV